MERDEISMDNWELEIKLIKKNLYNQKILIIVNKYLADQNMYLL